MYDKMSLAPGHRARTIFLFFNAILLMLVLVAMAIPLLKVISDSFDAIGNYELRLVPSKVTLNAYKTIFSVKSLYRSFWISMYTTIVGTALALAVSTMGAYVLSQKEVPGRTIFTSLIIFTMIFHGGMIPTYMVIKGLRLTDNLGAVLFTLCCHTYFVILLKNFFSGIPKEILECAEIDGCNPFGVFMRIVLPLSKPGLAAIGLFYGVAYWNAWFPFVIYINRAELYNLQVKLRELVLTADLQAVATHDLTIFSASLKNAVIVVSIIPVAIVYPFLQKHFTKGVNLGAIKG